MKKAFNTSTRQRVGCDQPGLQQRAVPKRTRWCEFEAVEAEIQKDLAYAADIRGYDLWDPLLKIIQIQ